MFREMDEMDWKLFHRRTTVCNMPGPKLMPCPYCKGKGVSEWYYSRDRRIPCAHCDGSGKMRESEAKRRVHDGKLTKASREAGWRNTHRSFP